MTGADRLERLGERVRDELDAHGEDADYAGRARAGFLDAQPRVGKRSHAVYLVAAALAALAIVAVLSLPRGLTYRVGSPHATSAAEGWLAAPADEALDVSFSDGSKVIIAGSSRARVISVDEHGAQLVLEQGSALLAIVPRQSASWSVTVGPYRVVVTGTEFEVGWSPSTEELVVSVTEGSVRVEGPALGDGRFVVAGETFRKRPAKRASAQPSSGPPTPPVEPSDEPAEEPGPRAASTRLPDDASETWADVARRGRYREAMRLAEAAGLDTLTATLGAPDLSLLADTARFAGKLGAASATYQSLRKRYPGTGFAASAAFSLGRMAFDQQRAYGSAASWFSIYLSEQPGGPLAAEASGRLIEAHQRAGDVGSARRAARAYLARYPKGAHARLATSLTEAPSTDDEPKPR